MNLRMNKKVQEYLIIIDKRSFEFTLSGLTAPLVFYNLIILRCWGLCFIGGIRASHRRFSIPFEVYLSQ